MPRDRPRCGTRNDGSEAGVKAAAGSDAWGSSNAAASGADDRIPC